MIEQAFNLEVMQQYLDLITEQLFRENELLNDRMHWMWTLQGLLFAGLGMVTKDFKNKFIAFSMCLVGLVSCLSIGYSILIGQDVLNVLNIQVNEIAVALESKIGVKAINLDGGGNTNILMPWILLPWFLGVVWLALGLYILFAKPEPAAAAKS